MDSRVSVRSIRVVFPTHSEEFGAHKILEQAVPVPSEIARFENQQVVFLTRLLAAIDKDAAVRCVSEKGETVTIPADKRGQYSLLSTNVPSWKLVPGGSDQLHEITAHRFVLRDVAVIEVGVNIEQEQATDKVFTNLTGRSYGATVRAILESDERANRGISTWNLRTRASRVADVPLELSSTQV